MGSPYADLDRPALSGQRLVRDLSGGPVWRDVVVLPSTGSTNAVAAEQARAGAAEGLVVLAEEQTAGRGRLQRGWEAPPRSSVLMSVLLRPVVAQHRWALLPLLTGVALATAVGELTEVDCRLKWPNDLLDTEGRKLAGVLAEVVDGAVVVGVGLNVTQRTEELSDDRATSLRLAGATTTDREPIVKHVLRGLARRYLDWQAGGGSSEAVLADYRPLCATLTARVRLALPGGGEVVGTAVDVDTEGRLVVREDGGPERAWAAGDVVHLRTGG